MHKILKDNTRKKIILLLNEKGSLSYTDLIESLETVSTGLLNYHLKVLRELLVKNETGQYLLSEKGKLAAKLLVDFPEQDSQLLKNRRKKIWITLALSQVVYLNVAFTLYFLGYLDFGELLICTIAFSGMLPIIYMSYKLPNVAPKKNYRLLYVGMGGVVGLAIALFGTPLLSFILISFGGPNFITIIGVSEVYFLGFLIVAATIGCFIGYLVGKRRSFEAPKWGKTWLEEF